jgi:Uma2 family endonuclease
MFRPVEIEYKGWMPGCCEWSEDFGHYVRRFGSRRKGSAMASPARVEKMITLEEFLRLPEIDEHPYLEFVEGRIEAKVSPQGKHSSIQTKLAARLDSYAERRKLGGAFSELRCTFAGRSIIPDVVVLLEENIATDEDGEISNPILRPPDIHIEIVSPDQSMRRCRTNLTFSLANGCPLGWLIDPDHKTVLVYRPGRSPERVSEDGVLDGDPVLAGYRLPVKRLFGWLKRPKRGRKPAPPPFQPPTPGEPS